MVKHQLLVLKAIALLSLSVAVLSQSDSATQPCEKCVIQKLNRILTNVFDGSSEFLVGRLDPWFIPFLGSEIKSPMLDLELNLFNTSVYGFKNFQVTNVTGFGVMPEENLKVIVNGPTLTFIGNYTASGVVFTVPINGSGGFSMVLDDGVTMAFNVGAKPSVINGNVYNNITQFEFHFDAQNASYAFDNTVSAYPVLSTAVSEILKTQGREIYEFTHSTAEKTMCAPYKQLAEQFAAVIPYNSLIGD